MTDFNSLDSARETIAAFDRKIAQAEDETRRLIERLRVAGIGYKSKHVKEAWDRCAEQTRPLRAAREDLVKAMATVASAQPPSMIVDLLEERTP